MNTNLRKYILKLKIRNLGLFFACSLLITFSGCGKKSPLEKMIHQLGGTPAQCRKAALELKLTSKDPVPYLINAAQNSKLKIRVRIKTIEVLGDIARRQNDLRVKTFLTDILLTTKYTNLLHQAVKSLKNTEHQDAAPALAKIRTEAKGDLQRDAEETLATILNKMVSEIENQWNSPHAAMSMYKKAASQGLGRGLIGLSKARFLETRGHHKEAAKLYDELGVIRAWWLLGPFPNLQGTGFHKKYPPEQEIDLNKSYWTGIDQAEWYQMDMPIHQGFLDFEAYFVETDNVVGYALIFALASKKEPVEIRTGSDDTLTVFLNNELIWAHEQYRGLSFDDDVIRTTLLPGTNTLLFKVCEDWGNWSLTSRITGPGDTLLENVILTLNPGLTRKQKTRNKESQRVERAVF